jgi:hypothetical protein
MFLRNIFFVVFLNPKYVVQILYDDIQQVRADPDPCPASARSLKTPQKSGGEARGSISGPSAGLVTPATVKSNTAALKDALRNQNCSRLPAANALMLFFRESLSGTSPILGPV